ncbi:MAG: hypothetical protein M0C28_36855 [Candidatus Moduliflexus flocculans]|nr:hypothetical protein [Candidatus Moduliflexus flocculans]
MPRCLFAREGCKVVLAGAAHGPPDRTLPNEIQDGGASLLPFLLDMAEPAEVEETWCRPRSTCTGRSTSSSTTPGIGRVDWFEKHRPGARHRHADAGQPDRADAGHARGPAAHATAGAKVISSTCLRLRG